MMMKTLCGTLAILVLTATAAERDPAGIWLPPRPAGSDGQVVVFPDLVTGRITPQNGVTGAPGLEGTPNAAAWKAAEFPCSRTHDLNICLGYGAPYVIDVPWIFRNFDADENDPANYDFACTDAILKRLRAAGVEPLYRLGTEYESFHVKHYNTAPPKDFAKWARICEHIIAHYTEGWADGFRWKIDHWEVWNEPDLTPRKSEETYIAFWTGTRDQFRDLWKTAQLHLKARFPQLKFGGAGFVHAVGSEWSEGIVREFAAEKVPLDFYSWHCYETEPKRLGDLARKVRRMLDANGYTNTLSVIDEWNYVSGWSPHDNTYSKHVWHGERSHKGSAFIAAGMIELDAANVDLGLFYDACEHGMNALFDPLSGEPVRGYYPFIAWRNLRRLGTRVRTAVDVEGAVHAVAARGPDDKLGILIARYTDNDRLTKPVRVTVRLASGQSLADATSYLTDHDRIYTGYDPERNADGSVDLLLKPNAFAYLETVLK